MNCTDCGANLNQIKEHLYQCDVCNKKYTTDKKIDYVNLFFTLTDNDIYKTLLLLVVNFILIELIVYMAKFVFDFSLVLNVVDFIVGVCSVILFYYLGYKLALKKSRE